MDGAATARPERLCRALSAQRVADAALSFSFAPSFALAFAAESPPRAEALDAAASSTSPPPSPEHPHSALPRRKTPPSPITATDEIPHSAVELSSPPRAGPKPGSISLFPPKKNCAMHPPGCSVRRRKRQRRNAPDAEDAERVPPVFRFIISRRRPQLCILLPQKFRNTRFRNQKTRRTSPHPAALPLLPDACPGLM